MNEATTKLIRTIEANGSISVAEFMRFALTDPQFGYYVTQSPFGTHGDFITSPEISQIFGEMIGIWCAHHWTQMGSPSHINLVEAGPGLGTLMVDLLRGTQHIPGFHDALTIHLIEISQPLRHKQHQAITAYHKQIHWHDTVANLPEGPMIFIGNEFLDALPIRQFIRHHHHWFERVVTLNQNNELCFGQKEQPCSNDSEYNNQHPNAPEDAILELCPEADTVIETVARHIAQYQGAALLIDYGYDHYGYKDTLQAVKHHQYHPILQDIGSADLTAHVDFVRLHQRSQTIDNIKSYPCVTQNHLLQSLHIHARESQLCAHASPTQQETIRCAVKRLIDPKKMGTLFKALTVTHVSNDPPIGFSE